MTFFDIIPEWCTTEYLSLCKDRDHAKTRYENFKTPVDKEIVRMNCNRTVNLGKELRKKYFKTALETNGQVSKNYEGHQAIVRWYEK